MKVFKHLPTLALTLTTASLLWSQPNLRAAEKPEDVSIKFSAYLWSEPAGRVLTKTSNSGGGEGPQVEYIPLEVGFLGKDGSLSEFNITARAFSTEQRYKGPSPMVFAVPRTGFTAEAPAYREIGQVRIPQDAKEGIMFFFPRNSAPEFTFDISFLPTSADAIPNGQAQVINLSGTALAAKIGDQQVALPVNAVQKITISGTERNRLPVLLGAQNEDGRWQRKLQRDISLHNASALLFLIHQINGSYQIETIRLRR